MTDLNWVDFSILAILFVSVLAGLVRGFAKEVISLLTWIAAAVVASIFCRTVAAWFTSIPSVQSALTSAASNTGVNAAQPISLLALGLSFIAIFVLVLLVGKIISYIVSSAIEDGGIGFINRFLGAVFGAIRGVVLVVVVIFLVQLTSAATEDYWTQSVLIPKFSPAVQLIRNTVQPGIVKMTGQTIDNLKSQAKGIYQ